jgi:hypothetical protein
VDVYLLNPAGTEVVAGSHEDNVASGDPIEIFEFVNSGPTADFNVMIVSFQGPLPSRIKYLDFNDVITIVDAPTASSTLFGHPNAAGAGAVGAAFFADTPVFGTSPPLVEPFSSAGGTPILFDTAGNRVAAPVVRLKPDFIAPDGVNTTFFGQQISGGDNFPNFFGTSAAAPHAAAVAALMLERDASLGPATIYDRLRQSAIDMASPGFDFDTGFGLIQADIAVGGRSPLVAAVLPSSRSVQVNKIATAFATVLNSSNSTPALGVTISPTIAIPGSFAFQTTNPATNVPTGSPNTPVDIPPGGAQTFVLSFVLDQPFGPTDVPFKVSGSNVSTVLPIDGVNTLLLSASPASVPDIVALAATSGSGLITDITGPNGVGAFAVATVNVGASGSITVTADTGDAVLLPLSLSVCETDPVTAQCVASPTSSAETTINAGATPTFSIFATGNGNIAFAPATNRIFVRFKDASGVTRGSTSTAVRTQ